MTSPTGSRFEGQPAKRMTLLMTFHDHAGRKGLESEILHRARKAKLAGATVYEATEGFGHSGTLHRSHLLADDAPLAIVIVDTPAKIDAFFGSISGLLNGINVIFDNVEMLHL